MFIFKKNHLIIQTFQMKKIKIYSYGCLLIIPIISVFFSFNSINQNKEENVSEFTKIGKHYWCNQNLKVNKFRNGELVFEAKTDEDWKNAANEQKAAFCRVQSNLNGKTTESYLYNFYALNDGRELCEAGVHIASDFEWAILIENLGGVKIAGSKLGKNGYLDKMENSNDLFSFGAIPFGFKLSNGKIKEVNESCYFWTSTAKEKSYNNAWFWSINGISGNITKGFAEYGRGFSVRCVKD